MMSAASSTSESGDKQINATLDHLNSAFRQHSICVKTLQKTKEKNNFPNKLLLFYAVECGLKYLLLKIDGRTTTASLDAKCRSHDLSILLGEIKRSIKLTGNIKGAPQFKLKDDRSNKKTRNISQAHEAWRYGVQIDPLCETEIVDWLEQVSTWIEKFEDEDDKH